MARDGDTQLYLTDGRVEASLTGSPELFIRILAAVRHGTDSVEELLKEAAAYDEEASPRLLEARDDTTNENAPFRVDVREHRVRFPGDRVEFGRRGVLPYREGGELHDDDLRTFLLPPEWEIVDGDAHAPLDAKGELRREKALWSSVLPPQVERPGKVRLDGIDLAPTNLRDLQVWTLSADARAPEINGKSVYEILHEGMRKGAVTGRRGSKPHRADSSPSAR